MRGSSLFIGAVMIVTVSGFAAGAFAQVPEGYEVVVLANDLGVHQRPGINNRSEVVWSSSFCPTANIYLYSEGRIRQISDGTMNDHWPDLNNVGMLTWKRGDDCFRPFDLIVYENGSANELPGAPTIFSMAALNDRGTIVWSHDATGEGLDVQLFLYEGEEIRQLTDDGLTNQGARVNARGDIAWVRYDFFVSPWTSTVMLCSNGKTLELTDGTGQPQGTDINDAGQVVYHQVEGNQRVIKVWDQGQVTTIGVGTTPRINNKGDITFGRWNDDAEKWDTMLYWDGEFYRLSDMGLSSAGRDINDHVEVAWRVFDPNTGDTGILMLRRIAPSGDMDNDCHVDFRDFAQVQKCFTGADQGPPGGLLGDCTRSDLDRDGDVDVDDFDAFLEAYTGPGEMVPGCEP